MAIPVYGGINPHNGYAFAHVDLEVQVLEDLDVAPTRILEPDVLEANRTTPRWVDLDTRVGWDGRLPVNQVENADSSADTAHDRRLSDVITARQHPGGSRAAFNVRRIH